MKTKIKKEYKIYKLLAGYTQIRKSYIFLEYFMVVVHLILGCFLILLNIKDQLKQSVPFLGQAISNFQQKYMVINTAYFLGYVSISLSILLSLIISARFKLMPSYNQFNRYPKIEKILHALSIVIRYIFQLTIYLTGWGITHIYHTEGLLLFLVLGILPITIYSYLNTRQNSISLYKWFTFPYIIFASLLKTVLSQAIIIMVSFYFIFTERMLLKKISYGVIIVLSTFVLKNTLFANSNPKQMTISLISLALLAILSSFLIFKIKDQSLFNSNETEIQRCYLILSETKAVPFNELKFNEFHFLYSTVMKFMISIKNDKNKQIERILQQTPEKITKNDFLFLIEKYLEKEVKKSTKDNIKKQIIRLKIRMELDYPLSQITQQLFTLHQEYQKSDKNCQHQFFYLLDSAISRYSLFNDGILQTAFIFQMNELHQSFQFKIIELLEKINDFWKYMTHKQIKKIQLDDSFDEIIKLKTQIEKLSQSMQTVGNFQRERKVQQIIKSIFNCYQQDNKIQSQQIKNQENSEQEIHNYFLILEENLIKFISTDLIKNLGQKGKSTFENVDKKTLFGDQFSVIIDNQIKNMNVESQKQWLTIPIFRKNGFFDLRKINIMWYPSLDTKSRIMVRFSQEYEYKKQGYIIYQNKSDTIKYVNENFLSHFGLIKERFMQKLANEQMFFNELFTQGDMNGQQIKRQIKEDTVIKCKMYIKDFIDKPKINLVEVQIKVVKLIGINNQPCFSILRVSKNNQKKALTSDTKSNSPSTRNGQRQRTFIMEQNLQNSNQRYLAAKFQNQRFFCPIPNNYESKITEKQAQLEQKNRWVWRYYIHILIAIMFLAIIILWGLSFRFFSDRIQSYRSEREALENTSEQYALLYQLYTLVSKRYYMKKFPQQIELATNKTYEYVDNFYKTNQQASIDDFLRRYLTQINEQPNRNIKYNLQFEFFNITTSSEKSTLLDYAEKFKRNLVNNNIDFLLKNYGSFRDLTIEYEGAFIQDQRISEIVESYYVYIYVLIGSTLLCTFLIVYTQLKIEAAISVIYDLIKLLPKRKFHENYEKFKKKKNQIINSLYKPVECLKKNVQTNNIDQNTSHTVESKSTFLNGITHSQLQTQNKISNDQFQHSQNHFSQKLNETQPNQNEINQKNSLLSQTEIQKKQKNTIQRLIDQPILLKISRKLYFIFIFLALNLAFYIDYLDLNAEKQGIIQLFDMRKNLSVGLLHVKRIETDAIIQPLMRDYFEKPLEQQFQNSNVNLVSDISQQLIFPELENFKEKARILLSADMCGTLGTVLTHNVKPCQSYLKGIVTKGLGQTFDIFYLNAKALGKQTLQDFGPYQCTEQKCTEYYEHVYVSSLMGETIRLAKRILSSETEILTESLSQKKANKIIIKMAVILVFLIVYFFYDGHLKQRCKRSIDYFRMIPKELMCSMKVTVYMRKNETLSQFDIL